MNLHPFITALARLYGGFKNCPNRSRCKEAHFFTSTEIRASLRRLLRCFESILAVLAFITASVVADPGASSSNKPACCAKEPAAATPLSDRSLYQLDSSWTNDAGAALKLASLRGRPQIVTMFFANCEYACPILVQDMKRIEAALPENLRTNVGFVLVSFDSDRDTPAALAQYRKNHGLAANWALLRGAPDDVLELGLLLGVKFKKDLREQFAHSNIMTLLDPKGEIVFQQTGLNLTTDQIVTAVEKLFSD